MKKKEIYKQVNNYIVFLAFTKAMPHEKLTKFFHKELLDLYNPLLDYYVRKYERRWQNERSEDYRIELIKESKKEMFDWLIKKAKVNEFNPFINLLKR